MKNLYSVFDEKCCIHHQPCLANDETEAKWSLARSLASAEIAHREAGIEHPWLDYSGDFSLYCLGGFDEKTGAVVIERTFVCSLTEIKRVTELLISNTQAEA